MWRLISRSRDGLTQPTTSSTAAGGLLTTLLSRSASFVPPLAAPVFPSPTRHRLIELFISLWTR